MTHRSDFGSLDYNLNGEVDWKRKNFLSGIVGLQLSIPIFNAFETKARIRTAKINLEDAKLTHDDALQRVQKDISQAWQGAVTAHKRYEAEIKAEESCALAYHYVLKRYDAGMATLFDLSQSRQQWFTASENALRMKYEFLIRKKILDIETQFVTQE
ncbi:MAG: TolC family protein [Prevotella sp.]|nr:TolC family protein [Prevotella sp.]